MITICLASSLFPLFSTVFALAIAACKLVPPSWLSLGMFNLLLMNLVTVVLLKRPDFVAILFELSNINTMSSLPLVTTDVLYGLAFTDRFTLAYLPFSKLSSLVSS